MLELLLLHHCLLNVDSPIKLMPMFTWYPVSNSGLDACFYDDDDKGKVTMVTMQKMINIKLMMMMVMTKFNLSWNAFWRARSLFESCLKGGQPF